jgi:hypothetical protein
MQMALLADAGAGIKMLPSGRRAYSEAFSHLPNREQRRLLPPLW